jgi:hypothetical protein
MKAKLISYEGGEGNAAVIEIHGVEYTCMDCLFYGKGRSSCRAAQGTAALF